MESKKKTQYEFAIYSIQVPNNNGIRCFGQPKNLVAESLTATRGDEPSRSLCNTTAGCYILDVLISTRLILVVSLVAIVSCRHERKKVIGVVPKAISHLFFMSVHAGVRDAERDLGVEVLWNGPEDETEYSRQIEIVDSMEARHVDALAISATDHTALVAPVKRSMNA